LKSLNERAGVNSEDMAALEFRYLDVIDDGECGLANLEKQIASSPTLYFRAVGSHVSAPRSRLRSAGLANRRSRAGPRPSRPKPASCWIE